MLYRRFSASSFIFLIIVLFAGESSSLAQNNCELELKQAEEKYQMGEFDSAVRSITACLNKEDATQPERISAYKLLGKVNASSGNVAGAKNAFREMLARAPLATLNAEEEKPEVVKIFEEARIEYFSAKDTPTTAGSKNWPWIAVAGSVVVTIGALLILK